MYNKKIIKHFSQPINIGELENPDNVIQTGNPVCGDKIIIHLNWDDNESVRDFAFKAYGCATSIATGSIFGEYIMGKSKQDITDTKDDIINTLLGDLEPSQNHCIDILRTLFNSISGEAKGSSCLQP